LMESPERVEVDYRFKPEAAATRRSI